MPALPAVLIDSYVLKPEGKFTIICSDLLHNTGQIISEDSALNSIGAADLCHTGFCYETERESPV